MKKRDQELVLVPLSSTSLGWTKSTHRVPGAFSSFVQKRDQGRFFHFSGGTKICPTGLDKLFRVTFDDVVEEGIYVFCAKERSQARSCLTFFQWDKNNTCMSH